MYPTKNKPAFGVFVKRITDGINQFGFAQCARVTPPAINSKGLPGKLLLYMTWWWRIASCWRFRYDFLFVHYPLFCGWLVSVVGWLTRKPLVVFLHGSDLLMPGLHGLLRAFGQGQLTAALVSARLIVVPSTTFRWQVVDRYPRVKKKILVSPSGGISRFLFREILGERRVAERKVVLGSVMRISEKKGFCDLVETVRLLRDEDLDCILRVAGPIESLKIVERAKKRIGAALVLVGPLRDKELLDFFASVDIIVYPSRLSESLALVPLEAMAAKKPVIATRVGAMPEYLVHESNGYLCDAESPDCLAAAVRYWLSLPDLEYHAVIQRAYKTAEKFSQISVGEHLADRLSSVLSHARRKI